MVAKSNASSSASGVDSADANSSDAATGDVSTPAPRHSDVAPVGTRRLAPSLPARPFGFKEAYEITAPDRARLQVSELLVLGPLDVGYAIRIGIAASPRLDQHRDLIAERFAAELEEIDKIDTYTRGVAHADVLLAATMTPPDKVQALYDAALTARRLMMSDLTNLATQGLISAQAPKRISGEAGHSNVARDIQTIATILTENGQDVLDRVALTPEKIAEYQHLAYQLAELSARRNSSGLTTEQARDELNRALTLFVNAYAIAERVMSFLLWKDKAWRQVVPSLYASKSKTSKDAASDEDDVPTTATALPPSAATGDAGASDNTDAPVAPGARGGSPFGSSK